jgi:hypothetical protein
MTTPQDIIRTLKDIARPHHITTWRAQWIEREGITTVDELWSVGRGELLMWIAEECGAVPTTLWMAIHVALPEVREAAAMLAAHGCHRPAPLVQALADAATDEEAVTALLGIAGTPSVTDGLVLRATPMWGEVETPEQLSLFAAIDAWTNVEHICSRASDIDGAGLRHCAVKRAGRTRGTDAVQALWPTPPAQVVARFAS